MTYDLHIGDRTFSSWSLRGWLLVEKFGLPYRAHLLGLYSGTLAADLAPLAPARTVPVLKATSSATRWPSPKRWPSVTPTPVSGPQTPPRGRWPVRSPPKCTADSVRSGANAR